MIADICSSIALDKHTVHPVSHFLPYYQCCMSLPVILGRQGVVGMVEEALDEKTKAAMASAAEEQRKALSHIFELNESQSGTWITLC